MQRLLSTLVFEGLLQKNEETKKYQLGIELLFFGNLVEKNTSLLSIPKPVMEAIREQTSESVSLNVIEDHKRKCIENLPSKYEIQTRHMWGRNLLFMLGLLQKSCWLIFHQSSLRDM
ncbi:hypothetical protein [Neobacillus niacini]|uniref:hypothetical protein n=1 Tax=Neobacillus niacini TaxID=86668 RepID=UPI00359019F2